VVLSRGWSDSGVMFWWSLGIVSVVFGGSGVEGHTDYELSLVADYFDAI